MNPENIYPEINADTYDMLFRIGASYLDAGLYYESGYQNYDFLFFQEGPDHFVFVSKEERKKLGDDALSTYEHIDVYEEKVRAHMAELKELFKKVATTDYTRFSNEELAEEFLEVCKLLIDPWKNYFVTEYHSSDTVANILLTKASGYDLVKLQKNVDRMGHLKLEQRALIDKTIYPPNIFEASFNEVEKRLTLQYPFRNYRYRELYRLLRGEQVIVPDRSRCAVYGKPLREELVGEQALTLLRRLFPVDKDVSLLKGVTGSKGFCRGTVKKIEFSVDTNFAHEIDTMQQGQILVSGSTGPKMILACKKAGAIVTDEGGIISHAAVISREFGIPSVIGTKRATLVLNDGDLVEVDADHGVVRIVERAARK